MTEKLKTTNRMHNTNTLRRIFSMLVVVQLWHLGYAIINRNGVHQTRRTERLPSTSSLLPDLPKPTDENKRRQHRVKRHYSEENLGNISVAVPERIPKLSEVLNGNSNGITEKSTTSKARGKQQYSDGVVTSQTSSSPWRAGFKASLRTQGRIKKAYTTTSRKVHPNLRAKNILEALLSSPPEQCNAANVVCALTYSAKSMGSKLIQPDEDLRRMLFRVFDILHALVNEKLLNTRQLANACWAIAKHYDRDSALLPSPPKSTALSSNSITGTAEAWNMGSLNKKEQQQQNRLSQTIDVIASQLISIMDEPEQKFEGFIPQQPKISELCMTCWAFGILRHRNIPPGWQAPPRIGKVVTNDDGEPESADKDVITFEKWDSFGSNGRGWDDPVDSVEVTDKLFDVIASIMCGIPKPVEHNDDSGEETTDESHRTLLEQCTWSELANVGWAYASRGRCKSVSSENLLISLSREARFRMTTGTSAGDEFLIRDVAQLIWALGTLQADNFRLADDLVYLLEDFSDFLGFDHSKMSSFGRGRPLRRWGCADIVQVTVSLAHARIDEKPLLRALFAESNYRLMEGLQTSDDNSANRRRFYPWEISIILWAQARLYLDSSQGTEYAEFAADAPKYLLSAASGRSLKNVGIGQQERANIAWAMTVLEEYQSPQAIALIGRIFDEAAKECQKQRTIQLEHAHQLWQALFMLREDCPEAVQNVPEWFSEYLRDKWTVEKARCKISSARHKAISQALGFMGVEHYNEHDEDIDVAIVLKENAQWTHETERINGVEEKVSVAVEFDGPNHFTRVQTREEMKKPPAPRALGHTVLKYRLLRKQGWSVVRVPYYEFDRIPFWASMERQRYLQRKLKTHPNIKFSEVDVSEYKTLHPNRRSRFD